MHSLTLITFLAIFALTVLVAGVASVLIAIRILAALTRPVNPSVSLKPVSQSQPRHAVHASPRPVGSSIIVAPLV